MKNLIGIVYTTIGSQQEAETLAHEAVKNKYAACVNIIPGALSGYEWEGRIEQSPECLLIFKTSPPLIDALCSWIQEKHPYAIPALLKEKISASKDFFTYVESQCTADTNEILMIRDREVNGKPRFKMDKLIRDKMAAIIRSEDTIISTRVMETEEYIKRLKDKLLEEAQEVLDAKNQLEIQEELADILEVMISLSQALGIPFNDIESTRAQKKIDKGGFEKRIYSAFVELDSDNPTIHYYSSRPKKYPEIPHSDH